MWEISCKVLRRFVRSLVNGNLPSKARRFVMRNHSTFLSDAEERIHTAVRIVYGSTVVRVD